nr:DUF3239 domain-containing protein [Rhodococcus sp. HNM0569]
MRRLQVSAAVLAVLLAAGAVALWLAGHIWTTVVAVVLAVAALSCLWVVVWVPRKVGSIESLYAKSPLVPAVVSEVHPRAVTLLALIDIAKHGGAEHDGPIYALVTRNTPIQGRKPVVGERVPSVALLDDRTRGDKSPVWQMVSPMPIWWGTRDKAVLARAEAAIGEQEWNYLSERISQSEQVRTSPDQRLAIEPEDLPDFLR